jgi:hypothetical protein
MEWIDYLAPRVDHAEDPTPVFNVDFADTTDVAIDVEVEEDGWLMRLVDQSEERERVGDKRQALELLAVALRIDRRNDVVRARYFALAAELMPSRRRGDETLQISHR